MIHTTQDFYNKVAKELRATYFSNENHGYTNNKDYHTTTYTLELFNNGCLTYRQLIERLAKSCKETTKIMHEKVSIYVVSFGSYKYKPKST